MKKIIALVIIACVISGVLLYSCESNKNKDITYVVEHRLTTGYFNKYKLNKIESFQLTYVDENIGVMLVNGIKSTAPHRSVTYKVLLEKNKDSTWKVKEIYIIKE